VPQLSNCKARKRHDATAATSCAPKPEQAGLEPHDEHDFFDPCLFLFQHLLHKSKNERNPRIHQQTESKSELITTLLT